MDTATNSKDAICIHIGLPCSLADSLRALLPDCQNPLYCIAQCLENAFYIGGYERNTGDYPYFNIEDAKGTLVNGTIYLVTNRPALVLPALKTVLKNCLIADRHFDFLPYSTLAWHDNLDDADWRTFFPWTTRPFETLHWEGDRVAALISKGRALRQFYTWGGVN